MQQACYAAPVLYNAWSSTSPRLPARAVQVLAHLTAFTRSQHYFVPAIICLAWGYPGSAVMDSNEATASSASMPPPALRPCEPLAPPPHTG